MCGTSLIVSEEGLGVLEDIVRCEGPMEARTAKQKKRAWPKKKAKKK